MLDVRQLSKWYQGLCVFKGITFRLVPGDCLHLRGKNGSGKSTLINILAGLEKPTAGSFQLTCRALLVNHKHALKEALTVCDHAIFWKALFGSPLATEGLLDSWGLTHLGRSPVHTLSLGQRKRLQLCQLSLSRAPLWLLDEPHHGLDDNGRELLKKHIEVHLENKGCVILAHHGSLEAIQGFSLNLGKHKRVSI